MSDLPARMRLNRRAAIAVGLANLATVSTAAWSQERTIKLAVTDLVGLEELQREFGPFKAELEKHIGIPIEFLPVTNRTAALEALRFEKVDFVLAGPAEYVVMRKRANADVVVGLHRVDYYSMIVTKADRGPSSLQGLRGKHVAMGSVGSTSRHLGPFLILSEAGLDPLRDVKVTHTNVRVAWEALKRGDVDAVGFGRSDLESLLARETGAGAVRQDDVRILGRGPDLPNDLLMAGAHVDAAVVAKVREAIASNSDALIRSILSGADHVKRYQGMRFLTQIGDRDYDVVRAMYRIAGYPEFSDFIGQ